jgi:hypothetical protein
MNSQINSQDSLIIHKSHDGMHVVYQQKSGTHRWLEKSKIKPIKLPNLSSTQTRETKDKTCQ